jgi:hypothetical protein
MVFDLMNQVHQFEIITLGLKILLAFGQELQEDVSLARAQCLLHPDLAGTLGHRHKHDVH